MRERMVRNRWVMLVAGMWIQFSAGSPYVFGLYSESLKRALGYTQMQLDTIGFFKGIGANVGIHPGFLYLVLPPWAILAIGSLLNFAGYALMWLAATKRLDFDFWQVALLMLVAANAQTFFNTADVVTSVANFPGNRGTVIGLMKGGLGLSGAVLTFLFRALHTKDPIYYILFAALVPSLVSLAFMFFIKQVPVPADPSETATFYKISGIVVSIAFVLVPLSILPLKRALCITFSMLLVLFLASPLLVALTANSRQENQEQNERLLEDGNPNNETTPESSSTSRQLGENYTYFQALTSIEFWLLFLSVFCGMGTGLTTIDNVNQIGLSLGYSKRHIQVVVSLISVWNFLGRFVAGAVSDKFLRSRGIPRPAFIATALAVMSIGHVLVAIALPGALYTGTLLIILGYGAHWSLMPTVVSEIFGLRQFGALFNTLTIANPAGLYVFSIQVAGYLYDREARKDPSGFTSCSGSHCFMATFFVLAGVCFLGCLVTLVLVSRTSEYYKRIFHSKTISRISGK